MRVCGSAGAGAVWRAGLAVLCATLLVITTCYPHTSEARYLPTRHGDLTIEELLKALSEGKSLDELDVPNVQLPIVPATEEDLKSLSAGQGGEGGGGVLGAPDAETMAAMSELQQQGEQGVVAPGDGREQGEMAKRVSYQYICLDKYRRYRLCTRRYRR